MGYTTIEGITANQYVALGTVFENVDGSDVAIKDLVLVGAPKGGANATGADQIWVWDTATSGWTKYFYFSSRGTTQWRKVGTTVETTDTLATGKTFFFCRASSASGTTTLTLSGKVKALDGESSFTVSAAQLAFACNPWPIAMNIKDVSNYYTSGSPVGGAAYGASDQIWVWDTATAGWIKYFYFSSRGTTQWRKVGTTTETADTIPAGIGFFFQRSAGASEAATITFTK